MKKQYNSPVCIFDAVAIKDIITLSIIESGSFDDENVKIDVNSLGWND